MNNAKSRTIDRLVHYAGWTDKFRQIFGTVFYLVLTGAKLQMRSISRLEFPRSRKSANTLSVMNRS